MMVFDPRQGDLYLFPTLDGGEISATLGEPVMDQGFESGAFIALAGAVSKAWWGNEYLTKDQQVESKFAKFAEANALNSATILTGEDLAKQDLEWLVRTKAADTVDVSMSAVSRNRVTVNVVILIGEQKVFVSPFQLNWGAQRDYPASDRI